MDMNTAFDLEVKRRCPRAHVIHDLFHVIAKYGREVISRARWPMHPDQLESNNNKIKVIKRMAYGYRDSNFFFLKIKAAFSGNPRFMPEARKRDERA